jgi:uncharacterized repeat protein (TIGR03803 family)
MTANPVESYSGTAKSLSKERPMQPRVISIALLSLILSAASAQAGTESVLYPFTGGVDGGVPVAGLIFDSAGNAYSTTSAGGAYGLGTVFELSLGSGGTWTETVLHSFGKGKDGANPQSGLIFDASGNLYGTTRDGGHNGKGTVFELSPASGGWKEAVLHSFGSGKDGFNPLSGVTFDKVGNLYGTAYAGGLHAWGTVYQLTPAGGSWKERTLYNFKPGKYGVNPIGGVAFDVSGNLYGTTPAGGRYGWGNVFKLTNTGSGWRWGAIFSFKGKNDGGGAWATPVFDTAGNLYGTTISRGAHDSGTVYQLQPTGTGWKFVLLHGFTGKDGANPEAGVILDASGNVYGTTGAGSNNAGTVFELSLNAKGKWTENTLYAFTGGSDGGAPACAPVIDAKGNVYGTASAGGSANNGVVFEITP